VRTGYSREEAAGLALVRAACLVREGPDAVRGFYRGVFREGGGRWRTWSTPATS